jgi:hypothetical protein
MKSQTSGGHVLQPHAPHRKPNAEPLPATASIRVATPLHLCRVQALTREFCRSLGLGEPAVFQAVIAATELAHRLFIEQSRAGRITLSAARRSDGIGLDVRAENAGGRGAAPARVCMTLPLAGPSAHG